MASIYKTDEGGRRLLERYREMLGTWPVACEHLTVPTSQGDTFVIACGDKGLPPVLLFHGSGSNSLIWMRSAQEWSQEFRLYAIDIIGEPGLSAPSRPPLTSDVYVRWIEEILRSLSVSSVDMVGVSLGGWMALDFATRHPSRVNRLVLMCPSGVGRQRMSFLFKAVFLLMLGAWGRRKALALVAGSTQTPGPDSLSRYLLSVFKEFRPRRERIPILDDAALRRLEMPVLLIVGGRDALLDSDETLGRMRKLVPHLEARYLADAGHIIPDQATEILNFLRAKRTETESRA